MNRLLRRWWKWLLGSLVLFVILIGAAVWFRLPVPGLTQLEQVLFPTRSRNARFGAANRAFTQTVPIQLATDFIPEIKATGKLAWANVAKITAPFAENINTVNVGVGDFVQVTDTIATLLTDDLNTQFDNAWLDLTTQRQALADLGGQNATVSQLAAQADLLVAQEALDKLQKGPATADITTAQLAIASAQEDYDTLAKQNDPNSETVRNARNAMLQAQTTVQRAQVAYDAIGWKGDTSAQSAADTLQNATLTLENAKRTYEDALKPPTETALQKAQLAINKARDDYNTLLKPATLSEIAQAKANVAKAELALANLNGGSSSLAVQQAESKVLTSLTQFEEIRTKLLTGSRLHAPMAGIVVQVPVEAGQAVEQGDVIAQVATPQRFQIQLEVSEVDILKIKLGMAAQIALDVLPSQIISGVVVGIPPLELADSSTSTNSGAQLTTFPVLVNVTDKAFADVLRAGMSADVTFVGTNGLPVHSWLVPVNAIRRQGNNQGVIQVTRRQVTIPVTVELTNITKGEWTVIASPALTETDRVVGSVSSFLDSTTGANPNRGNGGATRGGFQPGGFPIR